MANQAFDTPIVRLIIQFLKKGFYILEEFNQKEVKNFIKSQQHKNGGFVDRGGEPDFYYSLFGTMLAEAVGDAECINNVGLFVSDSNEEKLNTPELYSKILINSLVSGKKEKPIVLFLIKLLFRKPNETNFLYRIFLFILTYNFFYRKNLIFKWLIGSVLFFCKTKEESPVSLVSALLVLRNYAGLKIDKTYKKLLSYFSEELGFTLYHETKSSDLLSTAVALFAIKITGQDLRLIAPTCLDLVQQNYVSGAFQSGDGDQTRDLEYTFYGLLALGVLA